MDRRDFIEWLVAAGGTSALGRLSADDLLTLGRDAHAHRHAADGVRPWAAPVLDAHAMAIVVAAAECILPRTDTPGATDAAVAPFIDHMLGAWYGAADRTRFLTGLSALDARARERGVTGFAALDVAAQATVLSAFDDEVTALRRAGTPGAGDHWFAMLKYLTVWGYCTSAVGMRDVLHTWPQPMRYDGNAAVTR